VIVSFVNHWVDIYSPPEPESEPAAAAVSEGSSPG
jgi:hypothetical protein